MPLLGTGVGPAVEAVLEELEICTLDPERLLDEVLEVLGRAPVDEVEAERELVELDMVFGILERLVKEPEALEEVEVGGEGEELLEELLVELED